MSSSLSTAIGIPVESNETQAFVLMTALPPTTGHLQLVQFAHSLVGYGNVTVLVNTQPHEPFPFERVDALRAAFRRTGMGVVTKHMHETMEQDPEAPGFWPMWQKIMEDIGFKTDDVVVASETYGKRLAAECGGHFFPYDIDRAINSVKATPIREFPFGNNFAHILPEFQHHLRPIVTVIGAESTGKTTLSRELAAAEDGYWIHEYARPFLENTSTDITVQSMSDIWAGQGATQKHAKYNLHDRQIVVQDTDLFATVGYWNLPHWRDDLGECPAELVEDAVAYKSDLYIFTQANIPFEEDPLRYGGTVREGDDDYWLGVCEQYELPYVVLESSDPAGRLKEARDAIAGLYAEKAKLIDYDRKGL